MNPKVIHITLIDQPGDKVVVRTNDDKPAVGRLLTPAGAIAIDLLRACTARATEVHFQQKEAHPDAAAFVRRLIDPDDLGHAATPEIRDGAREVLGLYPAETRRKF